jgi:hypothetical protein
MAIINHHQDVLSRNRTSWWQFIELYDWEKEA